MTDPSSSSEEQLFDMLLGKGADKPAKNPAGAASRAPTPQAVPTTSDRNEALFDALIGGGPRAAAAATASDDGALSGFQERLWLVQLLEPSSIAYVIPAHMHLRGNLNRETLEAALRRLWARHESLRTVFPSGGGRPYRTVLPAERFDISFFDFSNRPGGREWIEHYRRHQAAPMDLAKGPLFRAAIYKLAANDHALMLDLHHINGDGVSLEIIRHELFTIYVALAEGREPSLPSGGASYHDFIKLEESRRAATEKELEERVAQLKGAPTRINFTFDRPLPPKFAYSGTMHSTENSDVSLYERSAKIGAKNGLSPFMVYLTAFGALLNRHTAQDDLLVGVPISLRNDERFARTIGFFVNTCVARLDFGGNPTLIEAMKRTGRSVREMLGYADIPLDGLVNALRDKRTPDRPPLIQATMSFLQEYKVEEMRFGDITVEPFIVTRDSAMFELTLDIILRSGKVLCGLEYSSDAFEAKTAERLFRQFHAILGAIADTPEKRISEISLLAEGERVQLTDAFEGDALEMPTATLPETLFALAKAGPEAPAIISGETETTRAGLMRLVAAKRGLLRAKGIKKDDSVAVACAPGVEWAAAAIATMAEGATIVPVDINTPAARLQYILWNSGARLLLHDDAFDTAKLGAKPPCPCANLAATRGAAAVDEPSGAGMSGAAYIIYTSGTTGQPKGVRVSHAAFAAHCKSAAQAYGILGSDRALALAPTHFDAFWEQLFAPLAAGASVLIRDRDIWSAAELINHIERHGVTYADIPPQYLREVHFYLKDSGRTPPKSLRFVLSGGESLPTALAKDWLSGPLKDVPLINAYGPTEAVVTSTFNRVTPATRIETANGVVPIGKPLPGRIVRILDGEGLEAGAGISGELCIGGPCLAEGYQGDEARTERFFRHWLPTPEGGRWAEKGEKGAVRLYRTGDRVRIGPDDTIEFIGRIDKQIKLRGYRIEPGEIEAVLTRYPAIAQALVIALEDPVAGAKLVAYCVPKGKDTPAQADVAEWLSNWLPEHMIPSSTVWMPKFPTTASGKIDATALPKPESNHAPSPGKAKINETESKIAAIWRDVLGRDEIGIDDNFFDIGGHSLALVRVHTRIAAELNANVRLVDLFANPTVERMSRLIRGEKQTAAVRTHRHAKSEDVAVIGMACRFPEADNPDAFWKNLKAGRESIRFFTQDELAKAGIPEDVRTRSDYVPANGYIAGIKQFDAAFFGYTPKEAEIIDPQQRFFLEECWHALESAGYDPSRYAGDIGVFGGMGLSLYLLENLAPIMKAGRETEAFAAALATDKDFITTRVSYKLNLRGPSVNVNTACSTSLVATHMAATALLNGECDIALAGGASLHVPPEAGYLYQPGSIASPDGHCRAFAEGSQGTVGGSGCGIVALKLLDRAIADGDCIRAVIKGSAINNDGSDKVGFTAPGVNRQRDVIRAAMASAGIDARSIRYVEAHGTGTPMGDPIEIQALSEAYAPDGAEPGSCYVGSVKSNIGHLDTAAGVAGLIKAVLSLENGQIAPTLFCEKPSEKIGFEKTPFRIAQKLIDWPEGERRRAAVSSFGIGGTNAHIVLEEAPQRKTERRESKVWCVPISARSVKSLLAYAKNLALHIESTPGIDANDLWFTLAEGRKRFPTRAVVTAGSRSGAVAALNALKEADLIRTGRGNGIASGADHAQTEGHFADPEFSAANAFKKEWLTGDETAAAEYLPEKPRRRIPLPTYVFDHETYWVEPEKTAREAVKTSDAPAKLPLENWFHFASWEPVQATRPGRDAPRMLVIQSAASQTAFDAPVCVSTSGSLASSLKAIAGDVPELCMHTAALDHTPRNADEFAASLAALLTDIRALAASLDGRRARLILAAPHVGGITSAPEPFLSYLAAAATVVPTEYANLDVRVLLVDPAAFDARAVALADAMFTGCDAKAATYYGGRFWRAAHPVLTGTNAETGAMRLKERGTYLITGGLGGIGLTLAQYLARHCRANLILISRGQPNAAQREAIAAMEAQGAHVETAQLDISDGSAFHKLVDEKTAAFGRIDGVIHAAGVAGGSLIARTDAAEIARVASAKIGGTLAIEKAFEGRVPDFILLCSSLTATFGAPGQIAYAAANAWMDAFSAKKAETQPGVWTSVEWDSWAVVGMAARAFTPAKPAPRGETLLEIDVTPETFWPWGEHKLGGLPTLPGTGYLDLFAKAVGAMPMELCGVSLNEPMVYGGESKRTICVLKNGDELTLVSEAKSVAGEHARARIGKAPTPPEAEPLEAIEARCKGTPTTGDAEEAIAIEAGPRWRLKCDIRAGTNEALATLELPERFAGDFKEHPLHPALLDIALSYYIELVPGATAMLPWRYEKLRVFAPLERTITSHIRLKKSNEKSLVLDIDIRGESGRLLVQAEGYTLVRVDEKTRTATRADVLTNPFAMTPDEGVEAFLAALSSVEPVVALSTIDWKFAGQLAETKTSDSPTGKPAETSQRKPRPDLATPFATPGSDAQKLMAAIWQEVLGYEKLGIDDDLFELGADSLTALQASARLKDKTGRELAMDRFFENATIANLAEDIAPAPANEPAPVKWEEGEL
jgi:polyketide synthase PksJ